MDTTETINGNVTQIGHVRSDVKVYVEQKAFDLIESCQIRDAEQQQIFYLLGREYHLGLQRVFVVRSILEGELQEGPNIIISPKALRSVEKQRDSQFPGLRLIGWALNQPGRGVKCLSRHGRSHVQYFRQSSLLLLQDALAEKKEFYLWTGSDFQNIGGFLVYQEQDEDTETNDEITPIELWSEPKPTAEKESMLQKALRENQATARLDDLLQAEPERTRHYTRKEAVPHYMEKSKEPRQFEGFLHPISEPPRKRSDPPKRTLPKIPTLTREEASSEGGLHTLSLLTSISAIVLLITIIMGALMFHNLSTLSSIQTNIETLNHRITYMEQSDISEDSSVMNETPEE